MENDETLTELTPPASIIVCLFVLLYPPRMWYAKIYDPIKVGSIDGTDTEPHDAAVVRALNAECKCCHSAAIAVYTNVQLLTPIRNR